jgi:hypothetical protein
VTHDAALEARNATASAMSLGSPCRPSGMARIADARARPGSTPARSSRRRKVPSIMFVSVVPGQTQFARTCGANSSVSCCVSEMTATFEAQ